MNAQLLGAIYGALLVMASMALICSFCFLVGWLIVVLIENFDIHPLWWLFIFIMMLSAGLGAYVGWHDPPFNGITEKF